MSALKSYLHAQCLAYIERRIDTAQQAIADAQAAANDETKSSAGDKYETGRAMMQLEIEKNSVQLAESLKLKQVLLHIHADIQTTVVQAGSVVVTDQSNFYLAISAGKFEFDNQVYLAISPGSPVGAMILGLQQGSKFSFNNRDYTIKEVW